MKKAMKLGLWEGKINDGNKQSKMWSYYGEDPAQDKIRFHIECLGVTNKWNRNEKGLKYNAKSQLENWEKIGLTVGLPGQW